MKELGLLTILPPVLAIILAIRTKQVIPSLILGLLLGWLILCDWNPLMGIMATINGLVNVFASAGNTRTILFTLLIGSLIHLIQKAKGIDGFVVRLQNKIDQSENPKSKLQVFGALTGFLIFIESNISILTVGTVFQSLFKRYGIPKVKLAYIADSSSAPSCILFPINAWGAYIIGLLAAYETLPPFKTLLYSIPFNFYPILTLILVFYTAFSNKSFGLMNTFDTTEKIHEAESAVITSEGKSFNMIVPLGAMVLSMPAFLLFTGYDAEFSGSIMGKLWQYIGNASGSASVLYAVCTGLLTAGILFSVQKIVTLSTFITQSLEGMKEMLSMAILMVLAFALGDLCKEMGTGTYVASVTESWLAPGLAPAVIFLTSCFIAFSTGTSWGTFAIMIPIAIPLAQTLDINIHLALAAVLGGGVFGDHCSPISDTTLISSMASGVDHIDHVKTQLPYALFTGGLAIIMYLIFGFLMA
ncbi:MAG: tetracycline resistance efflux pump [Cyclobacteriaceae bacterium]|jgi:tetracycline resistance efflux pump